MGAKTAVTAEEYLRTSFPGVDREYRDGELLERAMPDYSHGRTQFMLASFFGGLTQRLPLFPCIETRMKVRDGLYRIPDLAVFHASPPERNVPDRPPLVAIEILSPDDRMSEVLEKLQDFRSWGVAHVWLVNPYSKRMYVFDGGLVEVPALRIPELGVEMTPGDVFG